MASTFLRKVREYLQRIHNDLQTSSKASCKNILKPTIDFMDQMSTIEKSLQSLEKTNNELQKTAQVILSGIRCRPA